MIAPAYSGNLRSARISSGIVGVLAVLLWQTAGAQRIHLPPVTRAAWENGIRLTLMEYRRAPTLNVIAVFEGGSSSDPAGKAGAADLMASLLRRGTEKYTAPRLAEEIDALGGALEASAGDDRIMVSLDVLAQDADRGLDLLAEVIRRPTFPAAEVERARQLAISGLQSLADDPGAVADRVATETVFAGHPYGAQPTVASLKAITQEEIIGRYRRLLRPDRMILVAVGDVRTREMMAKLRSRFGDWTPPPWGDEEADAVPPVRPTPPRTVLIDKPDATQTQVRFARTAFPRRSPDYFAAQLASAILGGGFTSRLVEEIRVNRSLTYGIGSAFRPRKAGGDFVISTFTKIETTRALIDATRAVLRRTAEKGVTAAEVKKIKGYLGGLFAIGTQTPEALASRLADIAFYRLPEDYLQTYLMRLRSVSLAEVNRIARTYFRPETLSVILVAPAKRIEAQLGGMGTVEQKSVETVGK